MYSLKIRKIGNALGVILPKDAVAQLHIKEGEVVFITEAADGGFRLTPYDPDFERQMRLAEEGFGQYRNTLRELAK
ncbi:MAG: AbrB family transcriptional regulator [Rhodospirillales bacterium]|nr:AbrB family transcriptional regulator [Rhodospirillales bacterium]